MTNSSRAKWAFLSAAIAFLLVAVLPLTQGRPLSVPFFVLAMALIVVGAKVGRRKSIQSPPAP